MAKPKTTPRTTSRARRSTLSAPLSVRLCPDPTKDERMRRWASKIAADLPSGLSDALVVLRYAERLAYWAAQGEPFDARRARAAR